MKVRCDRWRVVEDSRAVHFLHGLCDLAVQPCSTCGAEGVVERLPHERVREIIRDRPLADRDEQLRSQRRVERVERHPLVESRNSSNDLEVHAAGARGRRPQQGLRRLRQLPQAARKQPYGKGDAKLAEFAQHTAFATMLCEPCLPHVRSFASDASTQVMTP
jgi:hypothetical protein